MLTPHEEDTLARILQAVSPPPTEEKEFDQARDHLGRFKRQEEESPSQSVEWVRMRGDGNTYVRREGNLIRDWSIILGILIVVGIAF